MNDHDGPILFAYDGSDQAQAAIRQAGQQLRTDRDAVVLTVWQPFAALPFPVGADVDLELEKEARRLAEQGARVARSAGFRATARAEVGDSVWRSILESAHDHGASIVVMGSHGRNGLEAALLGSVATTVSRHADLPVMIVHPPR